MTIDGLMRCGQVSARHGVPIKTRLDSRYDASRGGKTRHCGNCKHFKAPSGCEIVGGVIAFYGLCDWWKAKA